MLTVRLERINLRKARRIASLAFLPSIRTKKGAKIARTALKILSTMHRQEKLHVRAARKDELQTKERLCVRRAQPENL